MTCYIGKSVDLAERYKQHLEKFKKGTHSKRMQREYEVSGVPSCDVVVLAHPDHLDILESVYIKKYHDHYGTRLLNTQYPEVPENPEVLLQNIDLLEHSTSTHLSMLRDFNSRISDLTRTVNTYRTKGVILPEELKRLNYLDSRVKELEQYKALPWWKKIFS